MGLSQAELLNNKSIQSLLNQHVDEKIQLNSVLESAQSGSQVVKISNFQALIDRQAIPQDLPQSEEIRAAVQLNLLIKRNSEFWDKHLSEGHNARLMVL